MNDEVGIGFRSASDWLRGWWEFCGPQSEAKYDQWDPRLLLTRN